MENLYTHVYRVKNKKESCYKHNTQHRQQQQIRLRQRIQNPNVQQSEQLKDTQGKSNKRMTVNFPSGNRKKKKTNSTK